MSIDILELLETNVLKLTNYMSIDDVYAAQRALLSIQLILFVMFSHAVAC